MLSRDRREDSMLVFQKPLLHGDSVYEHLGSSAISKESIAVFLELVVVCSPLKKGPEKRNLFSAQC